MTRSTMSNPILQLRGMTNAGTADYQIAGLSYFSDGHLQAILDRNRQDVFSERLEAIPTETGGTVHYYDYYTAPADGIAYEEGATVFQVTDSLGNAVTPDAINYQQGHISFGTVDQGGTAYYLTARRFDMFSAAAQVLRQKAAYYATSYDVNMDGQSMSRSQIAKGLNEQARYFESMARPLTVQMRRSDSDS